jgi:hypothetical protein
VAGAATSRCSPLPCPPRSRPRRALRTPAWPAWSLSGQARPPPAPNRRPGSASHLQPTNATWAVSPASQPPRPSTEPSTARQPQEPPPVPVVTVARPPRPGSQRHRLSMGGDGRVRTDGGRHQTAGHRRGGQQPAERRTRWRTTPGDQTPDGWTAGSRTPKRDGWTPMLDTPATDAVAWLLAVSTTATTPNRSIPAGRSCGQTSSGRATTRTAQQQGLRGHPRR